jgi:hypothetical protein
MLDLHLQISNNIKRYANVNASKLGIATSIHQIRYRIIAQEWWVDKQGRQDRECRI